MSERNISYFYDRLINPFIIALPLLFLLVAYKILHFSDFILFPDSSLREDKMQIRHAWN